MKCRNYLCNSYRKNGCDAFMDPGAKRICPARRAFERIVRAGYAAKSESEGDEARGAQLMMDLAAARKEARRG